MDTSSFPPGERGIPCQIQVSLGRVSLPLDAHETDFTADHSHRVPEGSVEEQIEAVEMFIFGTTTPRTEEDKSQAAQPAAAAAPSTAAPAVSAPEREAAASQPQPSIQQQTPAKTKPSTTSASSTPTGAVAMAAQPSHTSTEASSPEGGHGHGHFFKIGSGLRKHTGSVSIPYFSTSKSPPPIHNPPDHEASSRHVPAPRD